VLSFQFRFFTSDLSPTTYKLTSITYYLPPCFFMWRDSCAWAVGVACA